ncbi:MAG: phosphate acyltransferase PlsX [Candidatus Omnitrophica bacterium]|nr:phosphate acyltransferase PlsX [Candidatus Omnitrophota bacterium]MCM8799339.1 phosphate acyltransferase PlsX [Candidatus Omnitrophota bacterium]
MRIIVDVMGGDYAPEAVIEGALQAVKEFKLNVVLVGEESKIKNILDRSAPSERISIYPAQEVIQMSEPAALSIRKKKNSSIVKGLELLRDGYGDAFFSAGNTGAVVCASSVILGNLKGVERPGIAIPIPTLKGVSLIIDVGANIDPKPTHLLQYALMADAYFKSVLNKNSPTIGLLNIGEEETKGPDFMRQTHQLISESSLGLNFIGNIEGKDIFLGKCDIIICDGFVGNVALKISESMLEFGYNLFKDAVKSNPLGLLGLALMNLGVSKKIRKKIDYSEYGGAPLLGINGVVIIGHGRSNSKAIKNALGVAKQQVELKVNEKILGALRFDSR